jgi:hypothetical protein
VGLLRSRDPLYLKEMQMCVPRLPKATAWRVFNCLMEKEGNTIVGNFFVSFTKCDERKQMIEKILVFSKRGKKRSREHI